MFILREIFDGSAYNTELGDYYGVHYPGTKGWDRETKGAEGLNDVVAVVTGQKLDNGHKRIVGDMKSFIMTESGKTFERLS